MWPAKKFLKEEQQPTEPLDFHRIGEASEPLRQALPTLRRRPRSAIGQDWLNYCLNHSVIFLRFRQYGWASGLKVVEGGRRAVRLEKAKDGSLDQIGRLSEARG